MNIGQAYRNARDFCRGFAERRDAVKYFIGLSRAGSGIGGLLRYTITRDVAESQNAETFNEIRDRANGSWFSSDKRSDQYSRAAELGSNIYARLCPKGVKKAFRSARNIEHKRGESLLRSRRNLKELKMST